MESEPEVNPLKRRLPDEWEWEDAMEITPVSSTVSYLSADGISSTGSKTDSLAGAILTLPLGPCANCVPTTASSVSAHSLQSTDSTHAGLDPKIRSDLERTTRFDIPIDTLLEAAFPPIWRAMHNGVLTPMNWKKREKAIRPFHYNFLAAVRKLESSGISEALRKELGDAFVCLVNILSDRSYASVWMIEMGGAMINRKRNMLSGATEMDLDAGKELKGASRRCVYPHVIINFAHSCCDRPSACLVPRPPENSQTTGKTISWEDVLVPICFDWSRPTRKTFTSEGSASSSAPHVTVEAPPVGSESMDVDAVAVKPVKPNKTRGLKPPTVSKRGSNTSLKKSASISLKAHEKLGGFALEIFSASGLRRHTFAVSVDNTRVTLWYFDRTGALGSSEMDLSTTEGLGEFIKTFSFLTWAERDLLGFIPQFHPAATWPYLANPGSLRAQRTGSGKDVTLNLTGLRLLSEERSRCLVGRGSMVYSFGNENNDELYILKLSWQPAGRTSEADFFLRANGMVGGYNDTPVAGMAKLYAAIDLEKLSDGMRGKLGHVDEASDCVLRAIVFEGIPICKSLDQYPIREQPIGFLRVIYKLINSASTRYSYGMISYSCIRHSTP